MGMYSTLEMMGKVKKDKVEELKQGVKKLLESKKHDFDFVHYFLEDMKITQDSEGNWWIEWDDYYRKWYDADNFVKFIAPFLEPQDIILYEDSNDVWGYRIREDGTVAYLEMTFIEIGELISKKEVDTNEKNKKDA